ncbi:hypothetical protein MLD38_026413 [Melastoma candidum]|uniref:Uncharacterized protein n=1 Tax=Melastoma candidum TaxID=119954 RepID=A0ACB9NZ11_9MYRT|nr:hypothetical protein MLD38_026413 [Melastoma candidum]
MDLRELFRHYLQHLFVLGYFERSRFRQFYVAAVTNRGFTIEYFSPILCSMGSNLETMEQIGATTMPNLQHLITFAERLLDLATILGAYRARELIISTKFFAQNSHLAGCLTYLRMLQSEFAALSICIQLISDMETAMIAHGGSIPLDW